MQALENENQEILTPEMVSPTADWAKPAFKKGLKLRRKLKLRDEFGERCIRKPIEQPKLNRIKADHNELLDAFNQMKSSVEITRRLHAIVFNGLDR